MTLARLEETAQALSSASPLPTAAASSPRRAVEPPLLLTTKLAPPRYVSQVMGVWFLALALGNNLAGQLSRQYDSAHLQSLPSLFLEIFWWSLGATLVMYCLAPRLKRLMQGAD